jgi:hypothetical protein
MWPQSRLWVQLQAGAPARDKLSDTLNQNEKSTRQKTKDLMTDEE